MGKYQVITELCGTPLNDCLKIIIKSYFSQFIYNILINIRLWYWQHSTCWKYCKTYNICDINGHWMLWYSFTLLKYMANTAIITQFSFRRTALQASEDAMTSHNWWESAAIAPQKHSYCFCGPNGCPLPSIIKFEVVVSSDVRSAVRLNENRVMIAVLDNSLMLAWLFVIHKDTVIDRSETPL